MSSMVKDQFRISASANSMAQSVEAMLGAEDCGISSTTSARAAVNNAELSDELRTSLLNSIPED